MNKALVGIGACSITALLFTGSIGKVELNGHC